MMADRYGFNLGDILSKLNIDHTLDNNTGEINLRTLTYEDALVVAKYIREMKESKEKE